MVAKKRGPVIHSCVLDLPRDLDPAGCATVAREAIKHLLYMRGQCPTLYDTIQNEVQEARAYLEAADRGESDPESDPGSALFSGGGPPSTSGREDPEASPCRKRRRPVRSVIRRSIKFVESVEPLLKAIGPALFPPSEPRTLLLAFGPTPSRPKECHLLTLIPTPSLAQLQHEGQPPAPPQPGLAPDRAAGDAARRIIRQLVVEGASLPEGPAARGPTRLHVAVDWREGREPPEGFAPLDLYEPRMPRGVAFHMAVRGPSAAAAGLSGPSPAAEGMGMAPSASLPALGGLTMSDTAEQAWGLMGDGLDPEESEEAPRDPDPLAELLASVGAASGWGQGEEEGGGRVWIGYEGAAVRGMAQLKPAA